ncbi:MAG: hypothetical protein PHY08_04510, partial [Candidatus Cloacimonetes bacterium]|nr:hypothetical protein [Candidatus Cloacimonadota bacterium]
MMIVINKINSVILNEVKNLFFIFYNKSFKPMYSLSDKSFTPEINVSVNTLTLYYTIRLCLL